MLDIGHSETASYWSVVQQISLSSYPRIRYSPGEFTIPMRLSSEFFILAALILVTGCGHPKENARLTTFSNDPDVAYRQVQALFPVGIPESQAVDIFNENGLEISLLETDHTSNHMVVGTIKEGKSEWTIGVSIMNGKVIGHSVNITGP